MKTSYLIAFQVNSSEFLMIWIAGFMQKIRFLMKVTRMTAFYTFASHVKGKRTKIGFRSFALKVVDDIDSVGQDLLTRRRMKCRHKTKAADARMTSFSHHSEDLKDRVRDLRTSGASFTAIAGKTRLTRNAVAGLCKRMGLCQPPEAHIERSRALDDAIRDLAVAGARNIDIARKLGISETTVSGRAGRLQIPDRRRKSPQRTIIRISKPKVPPVVEKAPEPVRAPDPATAVAFSTASGCRYALWATEETELSRKRVCGGTISKGSYCAYHAALVYVPYERRRAA